MSVDALEIARPTHSLQAQGVVHGDATEREETSSRMDSSRIPLACCLMCFFMIYELIAVHFGAPEIWDPRYGCYSWSSPWNGRWPGYIVCHDACEAHSCSAFGTCKLDALKGVDAVLRPEFPAMMNGSPVGESVVDINYGMCNVTPSVAIIARASFKRLRSPTNFEDTGTRSNLTMGIHSCGERKCWVIHDGQIELAVTDAVTEEYPPSGEWHVKCEKPQGFCSAKCHEA
jgi:hypothetical protein